jgi:chromosome segregation ATPase
MRKRQAADDLLVLYEQLPWAEQAAFAKSFVSRHLWLSLQDAADLLDGGRISKGRVIHDVDAGKLIDNGVKGRARRVALGSVLARQAEFAFRRKLGNLRRELCIPTRQLREFRNTLARVPGPLQAEVAAVEEGTLELSRAGAMAARIVQYRKEIRRDCDELKVEIAKLETQINRLRARKSVQQPLLDRLVAEKEVARGARQSAINRAKRRDRR